MSRAAAKPVQMAFLRIGGLHGFLMPSDAAMKVAGLLQNAFKCEERLDRSDVIWTYEVQEAAEVEFRLVRANQVRAKKQDEANAPLDPLGLPSPMRRLPR